MVFGLWFALATATTVLANGWSPVALPLTPMLDATVVVGWLGLGCSVMIYVDTHRSFWRLGQTAPRFLGTAVLAGLALVAPRLAALLLVAKLAWESRTWFGGSVSARLQRGPLRGNGLARLSLGVAAIGLLLAAPGWWAFAALIAGELAERALFFRAVDAPKMPGAIRS
jgi:DMSO reductase anchor subunit